MNIKTLSNTEINSFNTLKNFNKNNMLNFKDFSDEFKEKFIKEFDYFVDLHN